MVGFHQDLLLKERLQHDGSGTGFGQLLIFSGTVGQTRAAHNNRILQLQSGKGCL